MWIVLIFFAIYATVLALIARHFWRAYRLHCPGRGFNFRITDVWTAMLALTPTLLLFASALGASPMIHWEEDLVVGIAVGMGQLTGLFVGRIHIELPPYKGAQTAWESGISILTGAVGGAVAPFALIPILGLCAAFWPITLCVGLPFIAVALFRAIKPAVAGKEG